MPSNHLILCHPLLLQPSIFPSIRVFSSESVLHNRWPKYWSFSYNISPSNEYSGLISFRIDWLDLPCLRDSSVFSNTTVQKHQFFGAQLSLLVQISCPSSWYAIQPSHPLSSPSPPAPNPFQLRVFSNESVFASGSQSIGASTSASVLPMNIQDWFLLGWTDWISLQSKGLSRVFSNTTVQKQLFFSAQPLHCPTLTSIHDYWKNHSFN